ncbi:MAG: glycosyltransferase family 2 protein [Muribaculaceae bacterium]|nr:glycosyltransferase family 2 protein [Muribaculaceae bacterium]
MPKLEVLVSTFGAAGLRRMLESDPPHVEGVRYLVCCQNPSGEDVLPAAEALHSRGDTDVLFFKDRGLSRNRNHSLDMSAAPYLLIMDDDVRLEASGLEEIIRCFDERPDLDFMALRVETGDRGRRAFPPSGHKLHRPWRCYHTISFEIALRRSSVEAGHFRFSILAGIGAPRLGSGEEELFLHRMSKAGLHGEYLDIQLGVHPAPTTSDRSALLPEVVRAKGAVMRVLRGPLRALLRLPLEAKRSKMPFFKALRHLVEGYVYSIKHRREL